MLKVNRKSWIATAAAAVVAAGACTLVTYTAARADDQMTGMNGASNGANSDLRQAAMKCQDQMKQMATDPQKMSEVKVKMAKAMVMDKMSKELAKDPQFQQKCMADMNDSSMKAVHDGAKQMVQDPEQMKKMEEQIEQDPEAMTIVTHRAAMMSMMKDKMGDMGGKMMDKANGAAK